MARLNPDWAFDFLSVEFELRDVFEIQLQPLGHRRADHDGIVPSQLGKRLRKFLQPAVIRETPVIDGGIAAEVDFVASARRGLRHGKAGGLERDRFRRVSCARDPTIVQRLAPRCFEVTNASTDLLFLPVLLHQIVACQARLSGKNRDDFVRRLAAIKWFDQRLHDADRPVVSAGIAPRF